jgi:hypothetical protein
LAERAGASNVKDARGNEVRGGFRDWDFVCLGDAQKGLLGRIPIALLLAVRLPAERLIWSTGATFSPGISEADVAMSEALNQVVRYGGTSEWLQRISVFERESVNTRTSMVAAANMLQNLFGNADIALHLVTSANHAPRVARDASVAFRDYKNIILSVVPCHTSYGGTDVTDVVIRDLPIEN